MTKPTKQLKQFLENLHSNGYIDHDITKLDDLIEEYYPPLSEAENAELTNEVSNQFKKKADKWDALDKKIAKFYASDNEGDLCDIGEVSAKAFGYL